MFIEDLIALAVRTVKLNAWDSNLMSSILLQISSGKGLTQKQSIIVLKVLKKHIDRLNISLGKDISSSISTPEYKTPLRIPSNEKKISVIEDEKLGKLFKLEFPYNQEILDIIRKKREHLGNCFWDKDKKSWFFSINESSILLLMQLKKDFLFEADPEFLDYERRSQLIIDAIENYAPMLIKEGKNYRFNNVIPSLSKFQTTDLLEALFFAKKTHIDLWGDSVEQEIREKSISDQIDTTTLSFIRQSSREIFQVNLEDIKLTSLSTIIKHMTPILVIIPSGSEMERVEQLVNFLNSIGIKNDEMNVLFRIAGEHSGKFSSYIRENRLNFPLSQTTKIVFISHKIRKSIIESNIHFNCIINFNSVNVHFTLQKYLLWHHNIINVFEKKPQKELGFVFL
jgi:hypothetical protein